jgi:hypothetical protein
VLAVSLLGSTTFAGCSSSSSPSSSTTVSKAQSGCGTKRPASIGPKGVFIGVNAFAEPGVTGPEVLNVVPNHTVELERWCVTVAFVNAPSKKHPASLNVQFLSKASEDDEQRAAAYLRETHLFSRVLILKNPQHY